MVSLVGRFADVLGYFGLGAGALLGTCLGLSTGVVLVQLVREPSEEGSIQ